MISTELANLGDRDYRAGREERTNATTESRALG